MLETMLKQPLWPCRKVTLSECVGSSGSTFKGVLGHTEAARPCVVLLETVVEMSKADSPNMVVLLQRAGFC